MTPSSKRRLELTIDEKLYIVEIDELDRSPIPIRVNGQEFLVNLENGEPEPSEQVEGPPVDSMKTPVAPARRRPSPAPAAASGNEIYAPMPGDILEIRVKPGDKVDVGDQICSLEAMKMKSAIRSARMGIIASVEVSEGQAVAHGDVLVRFE